MHRLVTQALIVASVFSIPVFTFAQNHISQKTTEQTATPPLVAHLQTLSFQTDDAKGVTLNLTVNCGAQGHRIHLYIGTVINDWALGSPTVTVNGVPMEPPLPAPYQPSGKGLHEFIAICYGAGELVVAPDVWGRAGIPYSFRLDEDLNY